MLDAILVSKVQTRRTLFFSTRAIRPDRLLSKHFDNCLQITNLLLLSHGSSWSLLYTFLYIYFQLSRYRCQHLQFGRRPIV